MENWKTWRIGRLYFRFVWNTPLEQKGVTVQTLADALEKHGYLKLTANRQRYLETPTKRVTKDAVAELFKSGALKLGALLALIVSTSCASVDRYKYEPTLAEYEAAMPGYSTPPPMHQEVNGKVNPHDLAGYGCSSERSPVPNPDGSPKYNTVCW